MTGTSAVSEGAMEGGKETGRNGYSEGEDWIRKVEMQYETSLEDVYRCAVKFYRDQNGKAFHVSYDDRNKLVAYTKQVTHGKYTDVRKNNEGGDGTEAGFFDLIGNDRLLAWEALGDLSKRDGMAGFVTLLDAVCPQFRLHMEAQKRDSEEKKRQEIVEFEERQRRTERETRLRSEEQRRQIQEALNRQTYPQFRAYAEQQFPNSPEQQHALIGQLQEQHYQQYMAQVYAQQLLPQQDNAAGEESAVAAQQEAPVGQQTDGDETESGGEEDHEEEAPSNPAVAPASMWTRKDIKEFKETIRKEGSEGMIKVGHGETVTVRVPTHDEGACLFWEFSTDYYDIGFGVYFEWTISETNTVSVHISESDEEDEEEYETENKGDLEKGGKTEKEPGKPQLDEIIPVYRRDCHEEVYAGSHVYPGKGVYLLKFDNSYSLWRSKKLYYRVYYSK